MKRLLLLLMLLSALLLPASGQATRGSLTGVINDNTGAVVPDATVTIRNNATGEELRATTDSQGTFNFPSLSPGRYALKIEAKGFKRAEVQDVVIEVSTPARVNVGLEVGELSEAVVISSQTQELVNTSTPTLTNVVNPRQLQDLPLPSRNPIDFARLQAGVAVTGTNTRTASVGGLRGSATNITQDGVNAMDNFVKTDSFFALQAPSLNSTSEFSVTVGTVGADAGRGVAQVRIVTPSGTNSLHGAAFWEHHNDFLNANTFFNNATNTPRQIIRQNFFGFNLSGPVWFPKKFFGPAAFDGRNRSFWFFSYEGFREPFSVTRTRTVLTEDARKGIFKYVGSNGQQQSVNLLTIGNAKALNPVTTALLNRMPLPNNTLVGDGLNTAGFNYNVTGSDPNDKYKVRFDQHLFESSSLGSHKLEFVYSRANFSITPDTFNSLESPFPGGIDAVQSSKRTLVTAAIHSTFGARATNEARVGHQRGPVGFLRAAPPDRPFFTGFASVTNFDNTFMSQGRNSLVYQFTDNFSYLIGSHTIRAGSDFQSLSALTFNDAGIQPTVTLGTNSANPDGILNSVFPNLPSGSTGTAIANRARNIYYDLTGFLASASATFNVVSPTSGFVPGATRERNFKQRELALYMQDQWRVKPNFTLNYGMRWEYQGVPYVTNGLAIQPVNGLDGIYGISGRGNLFNPGSLKGTSPTTLDFVNGKTGKNLYNNDYNNFAPSIGIAYSPNFEKGPLKLLFGSGGKSSIRAGYSISYLHDGFTVVSNALGTGTTNPGLIQAAANNTPTGVLTAAGVALTTPVFTTPITDANNFKLNSNNGLWTFDPNLRVPYVQQWSFGIEREFANNMAFEIRYVANHAIKNFRAYNVNEVNIFENGFLQDFLNAKKNLAINNGTSFAPGAAGTVPLPIFSTLFAGLSSGSGFGNATFINNLNLNNVGAIANTLAFSTTYANNRANLKINGQPAPNFFVANPNAAFAQVLGNDSFSTYNSLQVEIRRRFSKGLYFQANYTFSKTLTDSEGSQSTLESFRTLRNLRIDKHRASFDQTHRFVANYIYELPFGPGRRFFNTRVPVISQAIEGWQFGGIVSVQTGTPATVFAGRSTFNQANAGLNPAQLIGITAEDFKAKTGIFKTASGVFFIDPSMLNITTNATTGAVQTATIKDGLFGSPDPGTFGNFPRALINGPGFSQVDFSLIKKTRITEKVNLSFTTAFINAFNHANFAVGDPNFDSTSFFRITTQRGQPRTIHFVMGLSF
ncbi:MAG: TonB-dependent receptor [Blastocatellia bacterium]